MNRQYLCIDLKSFYASVECVERGLDPMTTDLVVADPERSVNTICLAVSPSMKAKGVKNRCRVLDIPKGMDYITATPRMQKYIDYAAEIYGVYLDYISADDIHVYSIDEAFLDVTHYLSLYKLTAKELAQKLMSEVLERVGVRATCGIGTNLYLCKIALDIVAKRADDFIGYLDEELYRKLLWEHRPITDFWRIGPGIAKRLERYGIFTMGGITRTTEDLLYRLFGVDAELLIDHAWGRESTTMADIKNYRAETHCLSSGQVLMRDYAYDEGRLIVKEMADLLCLDMVKKNVVTGSMSLYVGYSGRDGIPPAKGTVKLECETNADTLIVPAVAELYDRIVDPNIPIRRVNLTCNRIESDENARQLSLFDTDSGKLERAKKIQSTILSIKERFGKNSILKGMNLEEGAMTMTRNRQIGGHKSGE